MIKTPAVSAPITAAAVFLACGLVVSPYLDTGHSWESPSSQPVRSDPPRFEIFWLRGELRLAGHTKSGQHEMDLLQVAAEFYPDHAESTAFEPLGLVPDYWSDTSLQALYALAGTMSAHAILSPDELFISGVSEDLSEWPSHLLELQRSIPSNVTLHTDMLTIPSDFRLAESCGQAVGHFSAGPIHFEKSSAEFRSSAYPVLDRIIAITTACRNIEISVTGHTDISGDESLNLQLSLKRARAVAAHIEQGGVAASRMIVVGAGSSEPIADNNTKYGRSLNRRIEVVLSSARP